MTEDSTSKATMTEMPKSFIARIADTDTKKAIVLTFTGADSTTDR